MRAVFSFLIALWIVSTLNITTSDAEESPQWHLPEGAATRLGKGRVVAIAYSPDGSQLAVGGSIGIWIYDAFTGTELALLTEHTGWVRSVAFSPDGSTLATGSDDRRVVLWDVATRTLRTTLTGHTDSVNSVAFSPDSSTLATGSWRDVILWDVATGTRQNTLTGHIFSVNSVAFSPDGGTLATGGSDDSRVVLWDVATGTRRTTLTGHTGNVESVAFSPDGSTLATGSNNVVLWDVATGTRQTTLTEHTRGVNSVAFSPDGGTLATGSYDDTVILWDVATGTLRTTLTGHTGSVLSIAFSPDGSTLATGSYDGTVLLWKLTPAPLETETIAEDVNADGVVNIQDLVLVAANFGQTGEKPTDVNGDGVTNILDLTLVAGAFGNIAASPAVHAAVTEHFTVNDLQHWLRTAQQENLVDPAFQRGIRFLEHLLAALIPKETALLSNYPNPFNPETWIPYQLAKATDVTVTIYDMRGAVVRQLMLGHKPAGVYHNRSRAAHWDGRNQLGEKVASDIYFYTLTAGDFTATQKMLLAK